MKKRTAIYFLFEISDTKLDQRYLVHDLPISHTITVREAATVRPKTAKSPDRLLCRGFFNLVFVCEKSESPLR